MLVMVQNLYGMLYMTGGCPFPDIPNRLIAEVSFLRAQDISQPWAKRFQAVKEAEKTLKDDGIQIFLKKFFLSNQETALSEQSFFASYKAIYMSPFISEKDKHVILALHVKALKQFFDQGVEISEV